MALWRVSRAETQIRDRSVSSVDVIEQPKSETRNDAVLGGDVTASEITQWRRQSRRDIWFG